MELGIFHIRYRISNDVQVKRVYCPSKVREHPAGTRFKAGRMPAAEASSDNVIMLSYINLLGREETLVVSVHSILQSMNKYLLLKSK